MFGGYQLPSKRKGQPTSERADLLQEISNVTGIEFSVLLRETFHLKDSWGCDILRMILNDTLIHSTEREWRRVKCAELIRKSKPEKKAKQSP